MIHTNTFKCSSVILIHVCDKLNNDACGPFCCWSTIPRLSASPYLLSASTLLLSADPPSHAEYLQTSPNCCDWPRLRSSQLLQLRPRGHPGHAGGTMPLAWERAGGSVCCPRDPAPDEVDETGWMERIALKLQSGLHQTTSWQQRRQAGTQAS